MAEWLTVGPALTPISGPPSSTSSVPAEQRHGPAPATVPAARSTLGAAPATEMTRVAWRTRLEVAHWPETAGEGGASAAADCDHGQIRARRHCHGEEAESF